MKLKEPLPFSNNRCPKGHDLFEEARKRSNARSSKAKLIECIHAPPMYPQAHADICEVYPLQFGPVQVVCLVVLTLPFHFPSPSPFIFSAGFGQKRAPLWRRFP